MHIFRPLRKRSIALVWGSQVFSSMGDELSRVATVWVASGLWGSGAGYLMGLHAGCAFAFSLLSGWLAEHWDAKRTMVVADLIRGAAVLWVPLGAHFGLELGPLLLLAVGVCSSASAFFDPALRASLATLAPSPALLGATNALMESTARFARVLGPGLIVLLGAALPTVHLFTVDAATYAVSALALAAVPRHDLGSGNTSRAAGGGLRATFALLAQAPSVRYAVWSSAVVSAAWWLVLPLGMGLLVRERTPDDVGALGAVLMAYGLGNIGSNLVLGSVRVVHPERFMFTGRLVAGVGFIAFAFAPHPVLLYVAAACAATGGPATDVGFLGMLQARYDARALARVYRLNLAGGYGMMLLTFLFSPRLFEALGAARVLALCGAVLAVAGGVGLWRFGGAPAAA